MVFATEHRIALNDHCSVKRSRALLAGNPTRDSLVLRTFKEGDRYIDGCVRTRGKFEHAFGYYVARMQLQKQPGHWSAFWLMGNGVGKVGNEGRDGTEIEISDTVTPFPG
jgi:beta-glucanase (GH16 family)